MAHQNVSHSLLKTIEVIHKIQTGEIPNTWEDYRKHGASAHFFPNTRELDHFTVYRARFINEKKYDINQKNRHSYPEKKHVTSYGRANIPDYPVFYCAENMPGAIFETIWATREDMIEYENIMYVSQWELTTPYKFLFYDISLRLSEVKKRFPHFSFFQQINDKEILLMDTYLEFFESIFSSEKIHSISSGFAFMVMYGKLLEDGSIKEIMPADILKYRSVPFLGTFYNYAISPKIIDNQTLELKKVFKISLNSKMMEVARNKSTLTELFRNTSITQSSTFEGGKLIKVGKLNDKDKTRIDWADPDADDTNFEH